MTYFEWISILEKLKTSPMDYDLLNSLKDKKLNGDQYIHFHFLTHVFKTIINRLDLASENIMKLLYSREFTVDTFSLELIRYKKELKFIDEILNIPIITNEDKNSMMTNLENIINNIYDILERNVEKIDTDGHYVSAFNKIMNSSLEE